MIKTACPPIALALALAACAPVEDDVSPAGEGLTAERLSEQGEDCFFVRQIRGFSDAPDGPGGTERIHVDVAGDGTYLFETFGACPALDSTFGVGFDPQFSGSICRGVDVDLIVPDATFGPRRCPVRMIRKLDEDEEGAG